MKDISNIIKEFEKLPNKGYLQKRPKNEPTDTYCYLAIQLSKCMMRADALNLHVDPVRTEMTSMQQIMISHVCDSYKSKSKGIIKDENLLQVCSTADSK